MELVIIIGAVLAIGGWLMSDSMGRQAAGTADDESIKRGGMGIWIIFALGALVLLAASGVAGIGGG